MNAPRFAAFLAIVTFGLSNTVFGAINDNLIAHYTFENNIADVSGGIQNDGIAPNGVEYSPGVSGQAATFNGINQYLEFPTTDNFFQDTAPREITVSLWARIENHNYNVDIINAYYSVSYDGFYPFHIALSGNGFLYSGARYSGEGGNHFTTENMLTSSEIFADNAFHHIAVVFNQNAGTLTSYVDGLLLDTAGISTTADYTDNSPVQIGASRFMNEYKGYLIGSVDEVRIYNRVLSSSELFELYSTDCSSSGADPDACALNSFSFSNITDQTSDQNITINLEARRTDGSVDSSFNGEVSLSSNYSSHVIDPKRVKLVNGQATENIKIRGVGDSVRLTASYGSATGFSNAFTLSDPFTARTTLLVDVVHANVSQPDLYWFQGAVNLIDSSGIVTTLTADQNQDGYYIFSDLLPGIYEIYAEYEYLDELSGGGGELFVWSSPRGKTVEISHSQAPKCQTLELAVQLTGRPPVLILPGILGSTTKGIGRFDNGTYPRLDADKFPQPADDLTILNGVPFFADAGFDELFATLSDFYRVYTVPWDWRMSLDEWDGKTAWEQYLIPALDLAKDPNHDGINDFDKVDVVAHSLGGLLVRAYIQSDKYLARNDIGRFAMVGTPNMGSAKAYSMMQGGDPRAGDGANADGDCPLGSVDRTYDGLGCVYSRATNYLYKGYFDGDSPFKEHYFPVTGLYPSLVSVEKVAFFGEVLDPEGLVGFFGLNIPTGAQLLPTYAFLTTGGSLPRTLVNYTNTFLTNLNSSPTLDRMTSSDTDLNNVRTRIFASQDVRTIDYIPALEATNTPVYADGVPIGDPLIEAYGDGTVPACSAAMLDMMSCNALYPLPYLDSLPGPVVPDLIVHDWADVMILNKGKHAQLMGNYRNEILEFLQQGSAP